MIEPRGRRRSSGSASSGSGRCRTPTASAAGRLGHVRDVLLRLPLRAGVLGYSPLKAGFAFLPVTLGIIVGAGLAQQLIARVGMHAMSVGGVLVAPAGMFLSPAAGARKYVANLLVGLVPCRSGWGYVRADHAARHLGCARRRRRHGIGPVQHLPAGRRLARAGDPLDLAVSSHQEHPGSRAPQPRRTWRRPSRDTTWRSRSPPACSSPGRGCLSCCCVAITGDDLGGAAGCAVVA